MRMLLPRLKHFLYIPLMKTMAGLNGGAQHRAFLGRGSSAQLCAHILRTGVSRVLVVTDKPLRELGIVDQAIGTLQASDVELVYYDGVLPDPTYDQVAEGAALVKQHSSEVLLAIGGGSVMDAAKIISAAATSDDNPQDWVGFGKVKHEILKLYAIPTTSGTGSEATMGAVLSDSQTHEKGVISGASLLPTAIALDADLMGGLPPHITAHTGMDALTHAIEAYISTWERGSRTEDSRLAVKLIFDNLARAYHNGSDLEAREGMAIGAYYAGLAINQVNVGNVHAIAHQLGGKYGIPHGLANALVLPHVLEFCCEEALPRLAELARLVGAGEAGDSQSNLAHRFIQAVRDLRTEVGIPDHSDLIKTGDFPYLADRAVNEAVGYPVPRLISQGDVYTILQQITP